MSKGLETTFRILAETRNGAAVHVLIPGLDASDPAIQEASFQSLLKRRSPAGQRAILSRLHSMAERWHEIMGRVRGRLSTALRDGVTGTDRQLFVNACDAIVWFREYDLVAALVNVAEDVANPHSELAAETVVQLVLELHEELSAPRDYRERRDPQMVRRHVITSLEGSVERFSKHRRPQMIAAFLLLAKRDNAVLRQILQNPHGGSYRPVVDCLTKSDQLGVIHLLLTFLDDPHVPTAALAIFSHRRDPRFIQEFLNRLVDTLSKTASRNLKRLEHLTWLRDDREFVETLDDTAQASLIRLVLSSGMKRLQAFKTVSAVMQFGNSAGRRAACAALASFNGVQANQLIEAGLNDTDPSVQVTALMELRQRGIPNAMARLIELVESPHHKVRDAARKQLEEFKLDRYLAAFDSLDEQVRRTTGALVLKIDQDAISGLIAELQAPARSRRMRGLAAGLAMGVAPRLEPAILVLMHDTDHMVRTEAALALASCRSPEARQALEIAASDRSVSVQAAAQQGLVHLNGLDASSPPPTGVIG